MLFFRVVTSNRGVCLTGNLRVADEISIGHFTALLVAGRALVRGNFTTLVGSARTKETRVKSMCYFSRKWESGELIRSS